MKSACGVLALDDLLTALTPYAGTFHRASGVEAFDRIAGTANGRTRDLSMATICQMAMDNDFLLFPHRIPVEFLLTIPAPFILLHKHHFSTVKSLEDIPDGLGTTVHIIATYAIPDFLMDIVEAREMRGAKNFFKSIGRGTGIGALTGGGSIGDRLKTAFNPDKQLRTFTKENPLAPYAGFAIGAFAPPVAAPFLAAGYGAYRAHQTNPESGTGGIARGAFGGYVQGATGASVVGGARGAIAAGSGQRIAGAMAGAKAGGSAYFHPFSSPVGPGGAGAAAGGALRAPTVGVPTVQYGPEFARPMGAPGQAQPGGAAYDFSMPADIQGQREVVSNIVNEGVKKTGMSSVSEWFSQPSAKLGLASFLVSIGIPAPEYKGPQVNYNTISELAKRGQMTPSGQLVAKEVEKVLGAPYGQAYANIAEPYVDQASGLLSRNLAVQQKEVTERYTAAGALDSGEYREAMRKLDETHSTDLKNLHADIAVKLGMAEGGLRAQFAEIGLELDDLTVTQLLGITGMEVEEAATKFGAKVADVATFRNVFAGIGTLLTADSLGLTGAGKGLINMQVG